MTIRTSFIAALAVLSVALYGCAELPSLADRRPSTTIQDTADTRLGKAIVPMTQAHAPNSGVFALSNGRDAFAAREILADAAERSLDVQYYIWHKDMSGVLLLEALRRAAGRGVRVRLLLDDNNTEGFEETLQAFNAHPNIKVRLFNPFIGRDSRVLGYLLDFARLDRRMHNKSFTADNQATIIGGRNVGDEYFGIGDDPLFVDLDVLAVGPVVNDVSQDFDRYWASASSYPARRLLGAAGAASAQKVEAAEVLVERSPMAAAYNEALRKSPFVRDDILPQRLPLNWGLVQIVSDEPAKALGLAADEDRVWSTLKRILYRARREVLLVSPYFVPGAEGVDSLVALARRGVKITVLTNSLAATDVPAVHAGYARWRKQLLEAGVALFELQPGVRSPIHNGLHGSAGSAGRSLHAKTFTVDGEQVFIGSFNFDPRSAWLNTEMGFVIESTAFAESIAVGLGRVIKDHAYQLRLSEMGSVQWIERSAGKEVVHDQEPGADVWRILSVDFFSLLPIESLL